MRRIDQVGMCRAEVFGELVQSVVSNKDAGRDIQRAVFGIEVLSLATALWRARSLAACFTAAIMRGSIPHVAKGSIPGVA
jgi:hypothetical protein